MAVGIGCFHIFTFFLFPIPCSPFPHAATAPKQGNCRGCACAFRAESAATLRQASCAVSPGARPVAAPRQIGKAAPQHLKNWETICRDQFPKNFPNPPEAVPNLLRRGEATRHGCGRMGLAPMRPHQGPMVRGIASAQQFPKSGAVAPYQCSTFPCACAEAGKRSGAGIRDSGAAPSPYSLFPIPRSLLWPKSCRRAEF